MHSSLIALISATMRGSLCCLIKAGSRGYSWQTDRFLSGAENSWRMFHLRLPDDSCIACRRMPATFITSSHLLVESSTLMTVYCMVCCHHRLLFPTLLLNTIHRAFPALSGFFQHMICLPKSPSVWGQCTIRMEISAPCVFVTHHSPTTTSSLLFQHLAGPSCSFRSFKLVFTP